MEKINVLLWDELVNLPTVDPGAELLGFLETLPLVRTDSTILLSCPRLVISRRLLKLWKGLNDGAFSATMNRAEGALELDRAQGKARFKFSRSAFERITSGREYMGGNKWAWFRGVWGGSGSIYLPHNGYYMAIRMRRERPELGTRIQRVLRSANISPAVRVKQGRTEYVLRDQEQVVTCLSKMGLYKSSLIVEETAIVRSVRSKANKLVNCDSANINKTLNAARAQLALVDRLDVEGFWDQMSDTLIELALARRANPSASLRELGQSLSKPVSKSTVEYRWRKLEALVEGKHK